MNEGGRHAVHLEVDVSLCAQSLDHASRRASAVAAAVRDQHKGGRRGAGAALRPETRIVRRSVSVPVVSNALLARVFEGPFDMSAAAEYRGSRGQAAAPGIAVAIVRDAVL